MSKRTRRAMLRTFREMAGPKLTRRRWRPIVRLIARQRGWNFASAFLWTRYRGAERVVCIWDRRDPRAIVVSTPRSR